MMGTANGCDRSTSARVADGRPAALVSGRIAYHIEWPGLSAEEKRDGLILPCVAHPLSDVVLRY